MVSFKLLLSSEWSANVRPRKRIFLPVLRKREGAFFKVAAEHLKSRSYFFEISAQFGKHGSIFFGRFAPYFVLISEQNYDAIPQKFRACGARNFQFLEKFTLRNPVFTIKNMIFFSRRRRPKMTLLANFGRWAQSAQTSLKVLFF